MTHEDYLSRILPKPAYDSFKELGQVLELRRTIERVNHLEDERRKIKEILDENF